MGEQDEPMDIIELLNRIAAPVALQASDEIASLRARVAELEADGAGTPSGRLACLGDYAVKHCGHSPCSSEPFEVSIYRRVAEVNELRARVAELVRLGIHWVEQTKKAEDRVAELEAALRPFAKAGSRRARAVLNPLEPFDA